MLQAPLSARDAVVPSVHLSPSYLTLVAARPRRIQIVGPEAVVTLDISQAFEAAGVQVSFLACSLSNALVQHVAGGDPDGAILYIDGRTEFAFPVAIELTRRGIPFLFVMGGSATLIPDHFAHVARCETPFIADQIVRRLFALIGSR